MTAGRWQRVIGAAAVLAAIGCRGDRGRDGGPPEAGAVDGGPPPLGPVADARDLRRRLEAVRATPMPVRAEALGSAVLATCGPGCACVGELVKMARVDDGCPRTRIAVGHTWPALEVVGRYLAQQVARATPADRPMLADAVAALRIAVPHLDTQPLPPAERFIVAPANAGWVGLDGDLATVAAWDQARFGPDGARVDFAPAPRRVPADQLDAAIAALAPAGASARPAPPAARLGDSLVLTGAFDAPGAEGQVVVAARPEVPFGRAAQVLARHGGTLAVDAPAGPNVLRWTFTATAPPEPRGLLLTVRRGRVAATRNGTAAGTWDGPPPSDALRALVAASFVPQIVVDLGAATTGEAVAVLDPLTATGLPIVVSAAAPLPAGAPRPTRGAPQVDLGPFATVGTLAPDRILRHLGPRRAPLLACYRALLAEAPRAAPTLDVAFFIAPRGPVTAAIIPAADPAFGACVEAALRQMRFPPPSPGTGGVQVRGRLRFSVR